MPLNKYMYELDELEKKQQNIYAIIIIILAILGVIENNTYKEYHYIIICILLIHIYIIYCSYPQKSISLLFCIIGLTAFIISHLVSFCKLESIYLFFIGIEFAFGALYNVTKNRFILFPIFIIIIILPFLHLIIDINLFTNIKNPVIRFLTGTFDWIIASVLIITKIFFMRLKSDLRTKCNEDWLEFQKKHIRENKENIDSSKLDELVHIAHTNHLSFIIKFKEYYPVFSKEIETMMPNIVITEFEVIALLKLNFTTKEIARATNSTVRAIESKKYRIRKKLQIPSDMDMSVFFSKI